VAKPIIRRVETSGGHYYVNKNDLPVPGVTTVLNCLPKEAINSWKLRKAVALALEGEGKWDWDGRGNIVDYLIAAGDREANKAAVIGTNAHDFAEHHMLGENPDLEALGKKERRHVECYLNFVRDYQPDPVLVEKVVTYIDPKTELPLYAGTMDLIAKLTWNDASDPSRLPNNWVDGLTFCLDYKASSSKPRPSHALQSAAYRYATHWLDADTGELHEMVPVDKTAVILLNGGGAGRCFRMYELDSSPVVFSVFKSLMRIHNFSKMEECVILGEL